MRASAFETPVDPSFAPPPPEGSHSHSHGNAEHGRSPFDRFASDETHSSTAASSSRWQPWAQRSGVSKATQFLMWLTVRNVNSDALSPCVALLYEAHTRVGVPVERSVGICQQFVSMGVRLSAATYRGALAARVCVCVRVMGGMFCFCETRLVRFAFLLFYLLS